MNQVGFEFKKKSLLTLSGYRNEILENRFLELAVGEDCTIGIIRESFSYFTNNSFFMLSILCSCFSHSLYFANLFPHVIHLHRKRQLTNIHYTYFKGG